MKFARSVSSSRRKAHKAMHTADVNAKAKMMCSRLSRDLRSKHGVKTMPIRKDDTVTVFAGFKNAEKERVTGKVVKVYRKQFKVLVENVAQKQSKGDAKPVLIPVHPSNCVITDLKMNHSRQVILARKAAKKD